MIIAKQAEPKIIKSKYELTLAEFPFCLLSKGFNKDIKVIEYEDTIKGKNGKDIPRKWKVYPHSELGFGTASTYETFFELKQIWKEDNFSSQYIQFESIYNLLKRMNKSIGKKSYDQIIKDLNCLVGINIVAKNAFWDNEIKAYVSMTFHLFESLYLYDNDKFSTQETLPLSNIKASDVLYGSILKNSLLTADFDSEFFYGLTPTEQRLALYLSKVFKYQNIHKREIIGFASQIPIQAKQKKHVKLQLKRACEGLIEKKFSLLESFSFEENKENRSQNIIFRRNGDLPPLFSLQNKGVAYKRKKKQQYEIDCLIEDILKVCGDTKSKHFYEKVAKLMPDNLIYQTLSEVKETRDCGGIKKSKGALFTMLIKEKAQKINIKL